MQTVIDRVDRSGASWDVLCLTEADFISSTTFKGDIDEEVSWRWWPGEGSRAMRVIIRPFLKQFLVRKPVFKGRCCLISLKPHGLIRKRSCCGINIVVVHGSHEDPETFFADLSELLGCRIPGKSLIVGDWNVDLLPSLPDDPFSSLPDRRLRHEDRRLLLDAFLHASLLNVAVPEKAPSAPGGPWDAACSVAPISRVPTGAQVGLPALLDFCASSPKFLLESKLLWSQSWSDHAFLYAAVKAAYRVPTFRRRKWVCSDESLCKTWCKENFVRPPVVGQVLTSDTFKPFFEMTRSVQERFESSVPASFRRLSRMPFNLRSLYRRIHSCSGPEVSTLKQHAFKAHKAWIAELRLQRDKRHIDQGRVFVSSKRLHRVVSLQLPDGRVVASENEVANECAEVFKRKWGASSPNSLALINDFVARSEASPFVCSVYDVDAAFCRLKRKTVIDYEGVCVQALYFLFVADPENFILWLRLLCACTPAMRSLTAACRVFGKVSSSSKSDDLRAIIPSSSVLRLLDCVLGIRLHLALDSVLRPARGCFVGARKHTQALDIGHAANLIMEKGLDLHSQSCMAQMDIKSYFDNLPTLRILMWLASRNVDITLLGAIARHQLFTCVAVRVGDSTAFIDRRSCGGLTGSLLALYLARIPVESSMDELGTSLETCAFRLEGNAFLSVSSYVDNIYSVSSSSSGATLNLELFASHLKDQWGLEIKPSSKQCMSCRGADEREVVGRGWEVVDNMQVLGWSIQNDAGMALQWRTLVPKCWGLFFMNLRRPGWKQLGMRRRLLILRRSIEPLILRALSAWGPSPKYVDSLNSLQRKMVSRILNVFKYPSEEWRAFRSRVSRAATRAVESNCGGVWWGKLWMTRTISWDEHLRRDWAEQAQFWESGEFWHRKSMLSWAASLSRFHAADWLSERRVFSFSWASSKLQSSTGTRKARGHVHLRWHDRVDYCKRMVG